MADREKLKDPGFYFSQYSENGFILDEVQFMPEIFAELRGIIDADRRPGKFLLLGYASADLIRNASDSLAGRIGSLQLPPFRSEERSIGKECDRPCRSRRSPYHIKKQNPKYTRNEY